jgi:hypothetical protein
VAGRAPGRRVQHLQQRQQQNLQVAASRRHASMKMIF